MSNIKRNKLKVIIVNFILIILVVTFSVFVFYFLKYRYVEERLSSSNYFERSSSSERNELKPYKIYPNSICEGDVIFHNKVIKTIKVGIDSNGFRRSPDDYDKNKPSIVFTGCSYVFGYMLEDNQTLPWLVSKLTHRKVYNTGYHGNGTQHMLVDFQSKEFWKKIPDADTFIYVFISDHIRRLKSPTNLTDANFYPTYELLPNGKLKAVVPSKEFINANAETRIRNKKLTFINSYGDGFQNPETRALFLAVLSESKKIIKSKNPKARFIIFDVCSDKDIDNYLIKNKFEVISVYDLLGSYSYEKKYMTLNNHPNAAFWKLVSPKLVSKLKL